ncbi:MFS transporter [Chloroflexota bacterium]
MTKKSFPVLALSIFSSLLGVGIVAPLLPLYAEEMGASGLWLGMIFGGFSISRALVMPVVGRLSDRLGRKSILATGLFFYAALSLGFIWTDTVVELSLVRLLQGVTGGMIIPIAQAYVGDIAPRGEEGRWMGYFQAIFFTGFGFGPLMGGILTDHFGMNAAFVTMAALNFLAFLGVTLFLPEVAGHKQVIPARSSLKEVAGSNGIRALFSFRMAFSFGRGIFATFMPVYAGIYLGLATSLIGVLLAVEILLMAFLQVWGGHLADRLSRRGLVILGSMVNVAFMVLIPASHSFWALLGVSVLGGLGGAVSVPAASALMVEEGRRFGMGFAMAIFAMAFSIGMAIGPLLAGVIADVADISTVFYFGALLGLLGTGLFAWFSHLKGRETASPVV